MSLSAPSSSPYGPSHPVRSQDGLLSTQASSKFSVAQSLAIDFLRHCNSATDAKSKSVDSRDQSNSSVWRLESRSSEGANAAVWSRPGIGNGNSTQSNRNETNPDLRLLGTIININSSGSKVFEILKDHEQTTLWHPSIAKSEPLYYLDDSTRVSYLTFKPQMGGVISARHSVDVVKWGKVNSSEIERDFWLITSSSVPTELDSDPENELPTVSKANKSKIRQINYLVAYVVVPTEENLCQLLLLLESDIKGWLTPSRTFGPMVAKNMDTLKALKAYCEQK